MSISKSKFQISLRKPKVQIRSYTKKKTSPKKHSTIKTRQKNNRKKANTHFQASSNSHNRKPENQKTKLSDKTNHRNSNRVTLPTPFMFSLRKTRPSIVIIQTNHFTKCRQWLVHNTLLDLRPLHLHHNQIEGILGHILNYRNKKIRT